eukprot:COSAG01_NODE_8456_length_2787_cov_9.237598_2_plen_104_part_00
MAFDSIRGLSQHLQPRALAIELPGVVVAAHATAAATSNSGSRWRMWPLTADRYGDRYLPQGAVEGRYGAFVGTGRRTGRGGGRRRPAMHAAAAASSSMHILAF